MPEVSVAVWVLVAIGVLLAAVLGWIGATHRSLPRRAHHAGVAVGSIDLIGMAMRKSDVATLLTTAIHARQEGLDIPLAALKVHGLAGGYVKAVVEALMLAKQTGVAADWSSVTACDLAGRDVMAIVRERIEPARVVGAREYEGRFRKPGRI